MRFTEIGVDQQVHARGKRDAIRRFSNSCRICCDRGIRLECERCPIRESHMTLMAYFADREIREKEVGNWRLSVS